MFKRLKQFGKACLKPFDRLSIFTRLALGYLTIIGLVIGVNLYVLNQLKTLTQLGTELVVDHYPTVETSKRLIDSLLVQLKSDKQYLVLRDTALLKEFLLEAEQFRKTLVALMEQEELEGGKKLLQGALDYHDQYQTLFFSEGVEKANQDAEAVSEYEKQRDALLDQMTAKITNYIGIRQLSIRSVLSESHKRAKRAETITQQLLMAAVLLAMGLAAFATFSILRPLRQVQHNIRQIGQGQFGMTVLPADVPKELQELVATVNLMGKQLQELDRMKSEFLANISHELKTPLASIMEGTQLLLDQPLGPLTPDQADTLKILLESSRRLNQLIASLLDLSKMEANVMAYQFVPTDMNQLVRDVVENIRFLADRKDIQIVTEGLPHAPRIYEVDSARIKQVLENLISNALKFSPEGSSVTVQIHDQEAGLAITVADHGSGISSQDLPHVFERFYQGKTSAGQIQIGSGIGLALAKKVVEAHHGTIWAESEVSKGTVVHCVLPSRSQRAFAV